MFDRRKEGAMKDFRTWTVCKFLAVVLCLLIAAEASFALPRSQDQADPLMDRFQNAKSLYFAEKYEEAKTVLETLITDLGAIEGRDTLKGQTYLLAGATYEKLKFKELAVKYYCRAKSLLGEGMTIQGLELKKLKYYSEDCAGGGAALGAASTGSSGGGGVMKVLGTLLFLAIAGGVVWYLFFSKNGPLRPKGSYTKVVGHFDVTYRGFNSTGLRRLTLNGTKVLEESFSYSQDCNDTTQCAAAVSSQTYSYPVTVSGGSFGVSSEYYGWDFNSFIVGTNYKKLCADFTFTVDSYEYKDGRDPGSPQVEGLGALTMDINANCTPRSTRITDCLKTVTITFSVPANAATAAKVFSASTEAKKRLD
jgi:hypothetical protein